MSLRLLFSYEDLFRARLDRVLDPTHALVRLTKKIDWKQVEQRWRRAAPMKAGQCCRRV